MTIFNFLLLCVLNHPSVEKFLIQMLESTFFFDIFLFFYIFNMFSYKEQDEFFIHDLNMIKSSWDFYVTTSFITYSSDASPRIWRQSHYSYYFRYVDLCICTLWSYRFCDFEFVSRTRQLTFLKYFENTVL